jgi:hypothetical protein
MQNALIVPLKILKGHEIVKNVGVPNEKFNLSLIQKNENLEEKEKHSWIRDFS